MSLISIYGLLALFSTFSFASPKVTHTVTQNPPQAVIRFEETEIKTLDQEQEKYRETSVAKMLDRNSDVYDELTEKVKIVHSSDTQNLIRNGVNNGLAGSMFEAYSNHIPLTLRPDDVWLSITAAFGRYVKNHAELMRKLFVKHDGKEKLVVYMSGSLSISDERFWAEFTRLMLKEMKKHTTNDLNEWLVPNFSTTTTRDRLVGQIVMMDAMREYFDFNGVLSCALTQLTLKGTLKDWQDLRDRAAKLAQYGDVLKQWTEVLLPVLDQFVAAYQGQVDEDFWQKMITFKRLGSGSQHKFRGWFLVFAPFDGKGEYYLNSKEEIEKTGIYATVMDSKIQTATVAVPVHLNDNGTEHDLVFWGGVSLPTYDRKVNEMSPAVDWAIIDKKSLSKEALVKNLSERYWEYGRMPEKYRKLVSEKEFAVGVEAREKERAKEEANWAAKEKARRDEVLKKPKAELLKYLADHYYWYTYERLHKDYQKAVTQKEFEDAVSIKKVELAQQEAERKAEQEAEIRAQVDEIMKLPHDQMVEAAAKLFLYSAEYSELPEDLKALMTQAEYEKAVKDIYKRMDEERKKEDDWQ